MLYIYPVFLYYGIMISGYEREREREREREAKNLTLSYRQHRTISTADNI